MTNKTLLDSCQRGDPKAQKMLYDLFKAKLMGLCRRYTSNRDDAQDVLQETFIKIFQHIKQLQEPSKLESWMKRIAVNTAINLYRKNNAGKDILQYEVGKHLLEEPAIESLLEVSDQYLIEMINSLPDAQRIVFNMFEIEGFSHLEIAELLEISEGNSRSRLFFAKQALREKLSKIGINKYERYA